MVIPKELKLTIFEKDELAIFLAHAVWALPSRPLKHRDWIEECSPHAPWFRQIYESQPPRQFISEVVRDMAALDDVYQPLASLYYLLRLPIGTPSECPRPHFTGAEEDLRVLLNNCGPRCMYELGRVLDFNSTYRPKFNTPCDESLFLKRHRFSLLCLDYVTTMTVDEWITFLDSIKVFLRPVLFSAATKIQNIALEATRRNRAQANRSHLDLPVPKERASPIDIPEAKPPKKSEFFQDRSPVSVSPFSEIGIEDLRSYFDTSDNEEQYSSSSTSSSPYLSSGSSFSSGSSSSMSVRTPRDADFVNTTGDEDKVTKSVVQPSNISLLFQELMQYRLA
ncbi:hypothetical protein FRC03_008638 [Tulasnella sp. 419]|nr:hypothetical protein FRC02_000205 [Tulasnella sp. 418]KAG8970441.1 hypothetical protein FRC03_008638 [Tulasnella sp. 419]